MLTNVSSGPRRHHFIPRLLLKGFASKVSGDKCFVYQFRVGAEPKELSAMDVGLERDFHGRTAEIEQRLSNKESIYGPLIRRLRDGHLHSGDETLIAEFVTDLIVRTKNVRGGLAEAGVAVFENFETQLNDPSNYAALEERLRARATRTVLNTKKIRKKLRKRFGSRSSEMAEQLVDQMCKTLPLEPVEIAQYLMRDARNRTDIPAMARDAQLRTLKEDAPLARRRSELQRLRWSLEERSPGTFVLGDLGPVGRSAETGDLVNPIGPGSTLAIYLPVSSRFLLCGHRDERVEDPEPEVLNTASVELSRDIFVADRNTERERRCVEILGRRSRLFDPSQLDTNPFE